VLGLTFTENCPISGTVKSSILDFASLKAGNVKVVGLDSWALPEKSSMSMGLRPVPELSAENRSTASFVACRPQTSIATDAAFFAVILSRVSDSVIRGTESLMIARFSPTRDSPIPS